VIPLSERVLLQVSWTDATNVAGGWHDSTDLDNFAVNQAWASSNTGWLVYEDSLCYVLAGRMTDDGQHAGLIERIPKAAVTAKRILAGPAAAARSPHDLLPGMFPGPGCQRPGGVRPVA
jgi:hypothetical protein